MKFIIEGGVSLIMVDKVIYFFEKNIKGILNNTFFLIAIIGTFLQCILFLLLLSDANAVKIYIKLAVYTVPPVLIYLAFILIPYSFCFLFRGKRQMLFIIGTNMLISILFVGNLWYYRSNNTFLNFYMFAMRENLEGLSSSIIAMSRFIDLAFLLSPIILIVMYKKKSHFYRKLDVSLSRFLFLLLVPIFYLSYSHIKIDKLGKCYANQFLFTPNWSQNQMMYNLSPIGYHVVDLYRYIEDKKPYLLSTEEEKKIKEFYASKEKGLPKNNYFGMFKGKNLISLQFESLEGFVINEKINGQEITPNLNRLLANSLYFSNYHEQTHNGTTSDATFVSNTSMYPVLAGSNNFNYPYNAYNSLPKLLKGDGYSTFSMHGSKGTYWNWVAAEKNLGFDTCYDITKFNDDEIIGLGLSDRSFFPQAIKKLEELPKPYYTFMLTISSHVPFIIPEDDIKLALPDYLLGTKTGDYLQSIHYTDEMLGIFMAELDRKGFLDDTVIVINGDHEGLHKYYDDDVKSIEELPEKWLDNEKKVPVIIYSKGLESEEIRVNGGQIDFLPTISYLFGIEEERYVNTALGRNLLNTNLDYVIFPDRTYKGREITDVEKEKYFEALETSHSMTRANYFQNEEGNE